MATSSNRQWIYAHAVEGPITSEHFTLIDNPMPVAEPGQTLVRVKGISIDPTNRNWILRPSYVPQVKVGCLMAAFAVGEVIESRDAYRSFKPGDLAHGNLGWQEYALINSYDRQEYVHLCTPGYDIEILLGLFGVTGLTAYFGLRKVGPFKRNETIVVAGASGACGSILGQLARHTGCRVVGIAGGATKCGWLLDEMGFDAAVDYKSDDFAVELASACRDGIDIFSDGVGGTVAEVAYALLNRSARVLDYGNIANYDRNTARDFETEQNVLRTSNARDGIITERKVRVERILVFDHYCERLTAEADMARLLTAGLLKAPVTVVDGIEELPRALASVYGENARLGKLSVRVA